MVAGAVALTSHRGRHWQRWLLKSVRQGRLIADRPCGTRLSQPAWQCQHDDWQPVLPRRLRWHGGRHSSWSHWLHHLEVCAVCPVVNLWRVLWARAQQQPRVASLAWEVWLQYWWGTWTQHCHYVLVSANSAIEQCLRWSASYLGLCTNGSRILCWEADKHMLFFVFLLLEYSWSNSAVQNRPPFLLKLVTQRECHYSLTTH